MLKHKKDRSAPQDTPPKERKKKDYEKIPLFAKISLIVAAVCISIYFISTFSEKFADFFNIYVAVIFRFLLATTISSKLSNFVIKSKCE